MWVTACFCVRFAVVSLHFCSELSKRIVFSSWFVRCVRNGKHEIYIRKVFGISNICVHFMNAMQHMQHHHRKTTTWNNKNITTWTQKSTRTSEPAFAILCATDAKRIDNRRANMWMKNIFASKGDVLIVDHARSIPPIDRQRERPNIHQIVKFLLIISIVCKNRIWRSVCM